MTLSERLTADLQAALRRGDDVRARAVWLARAAIRRAEIERKRPLSDPEIHQILRREIRRRQQAIESHRGHREGASRREELEMAVLMEYLTAKP